jgi:hypothetical protein
MPDALTRVGKRTGWGIMDRSDNRLDGRRRVLVWENLMPLIFHTRSEARIYARERYGYIAHRPDLQAEPHGWKTPQIVRVQVMFMLEDESDD